MSRFFLAVILIAIAGPALGQQQFTCAAPITIHDGDTWRCATGTAIRADGYDSPELEQQAGEFARHTLMGLLDATWVANSDDSAPSGLKWAAIGSRSLACLAVSVSYRRLVARCTLPDGRDLGSAMVRAGAAWDSRKYSRGRYAADEQAARSERRGLWGDPTPIPPWDWRKAQRH